MLVEGVHVNRNAAKTLIGLNIHTSLGRGFQSFPLASVLQAASHAKPKRAGSPGSRTPGRHLLRLSLG